MRATASLGVILVIGFLAAGPNQYVGYPCNLVPPFRSKLKHPYVIRRRVKEDPPRYKPYGCGASDQGHWLKPLLEPDCKIGIVRRGAMEDIAMKTAYLAAIAISAFAIGSGFAVNTVKLADNCPSPSASSVAALFAPCQTFEVVGGSSIDNGQAVRMGVLPFDKQPVPTAQFAAQEHATVGVARSKAR